MRDYFDELNDERRTLKLHVEIFKERLEEALREQKRLEAICDEYWHVMADDQRKSAWEVLETLGIKKLTS